MRLFRPGLWFRRVAVGFATVAVLAATGPAGAQGPDLGGALPDGAPSPSITWRLENPFRFFLDPVDTEVHRATWAALTSEERRSPVLAAERQLSQRHADGWAALVIGKTCWDTRRNRHACPDPKSYITPASHKVLVALSGVAAAERLDCTWLTTPKGGRRARGVAVTQPCNEPVTLDVPYPAGAAVTVEAEGSALAETDIKVSDLLIVGLGDSFGSGEGNPDIAVRFSRERAIDYTSYGGQDGLVGYPARVGSWSKIGDKGFVEENARWLDQACHRSLYSYQLRTALQLAVENPQRAITYVGLACSGSEVTAGLFLRYKGNEWVPNPPELSQISAAAQAQCGGREAPMQDLPEAYHMNGSIPELQGGLVLRKCAAEAARKVDLFLVSIGGNDMGFARLVANAVLADQSLLRKLGGWFGQVFGPEAARAQLERLDDRYKSLNRALHYILHLPWDQSDRVILTGYPPMALLDDGRSACPDGNAGMDVLPEFQLSKSKAADGQAIAETLNDMMREAAKEHGWTWADKHRTAFLGRGLCAGYAENALSSVDDLRMPRRTASGWEPYNPADYQPYASRQRWFRTPNDAFLTGNFHAATSVFQSALRSDSLSWFQVLLAATYSGAFHPTAEGHAAIADAAVEKARAVLAKYERRTQSAEAN